MNTTSKILIASIGLVGGVALAMAILKAPDPAPTPPQDTRPAPPVFPAGASFVLDAPPTASPTACGEGDDARAAVHDALRSAVRHKPHTIPIGYAEIGDAAEEIVPPDASGRRARARLMNRLNMPRAASQPSVQERVRSARGIAQTIAARAPYLDREDQLYPVVWISIGAASPPAEFAQALDDHVRRHKGLDLRIVVYCPEGTPGDLPNATHQFVAPSREALRAELHRALDLVRR